MKTTNPQDTLRTMSVRDFIEKANSSISFGGFVNAALNNGKNPLLVKRVLGNSNFSNENELKYQTAYVTVIEQSIVQFETEVARCEKEEAQASAELSEAEKILQNAKDEYAAALKKFEAAKRATQHAQKDVAECQTSLECEKAKKARMDTIVLFHETATVAQLEKYGECRLVASWVDAPLLKKLGIVDEVFSEEQAEEIDVSSDDPSFYNVQNQKELRSRLAYVRMVVWYFLNEIPYELAYADQGIHTILKANGLVV